MEKEFQKSIFYRALMTAVFVGIFTTILTLLYDWVFVKVLKFPLSVIINVASLIFFVNILFLVIGFVYYGFIRLFKKGDLLYIIAFIVLTIFFAWRAEEIHRTDDPTVNIQFRNLLAGIIIIMGIAAEAIPLLFHNKKFEDTVL
jgi:hypothetical protein